MGQLFADIIIDISHEALDRVFEYRVPFSLSGQIAPGCRVCVPFGQGNRETEGYVVALKTEPEYAPEKIKEILSVVADSVSVESQLIKVADFLRKRYGSSMIQALRAVLPVKKKVRHKEEEWISLCLENAQAEELLANWEKRHWSARSRLLTMLLKEKTISAQDALKQCKVARKDLKKLEEQGVLCFAAKQKKDFVPDPSKIPVLNPEQKNVVEHFLEDYDRGERKTYLLYGVTGSGKTEVYLNLLEHILKEGKTGIVLIPEISLTFQTVRRFRERFGERIALLHSRMSGGERTQAIERIASGEADVVIGPRSALFAPLKNLGIIIMDEEHDGAYKSDTTPKYHARETAIYRAKLAGASVVLGSATPSVESYSRALSGEYVLLTLKKRAGDARLPLVETVDLREEFKEGNRSMFSRRLREEINRCLARKEQIMLFLNRRGFAGFVSCRSCGHVIKCPHCDVSLTYHRNGSLRCHYCGFETQYIRQCPVCKSPHVAAFGLGTEKVEAAIKKEFPEAGVLRMDMDTTRKKHSHEEILSAFSRKEADILLGTQMIVKGHDYANVTLVGILAADMSLHGPDYRSGERTFQLLCQAAGRAGRGEKEGKVIIQTYNPEHYALQAAAHHSYEEFYREEYAYRRLMGYPPCAHFLVILIQSGDESQAVLAAGRIQKMIEKSQEKEEDRVLILNPGQAVIAKMRDVYRQVIYVRHESEQRLLSLRERLEPVLASHPVFAGIQVQYDLDPMNFM